MKTEINVILWFEHDLLLYYFLELLFHNGYHLEVLGAYDEIAPLYQTMKFEN